VWDEKITACARSFYGLRVSYLAHFFGDPSITPYYNRLKNESKIIS
jgi:hypothetical protein